MRLPGVLVVAAVLVYNGFLDDVFGIPRSVLWAAGLPLLAGVVVYAVRSAILNGLPERPDVRVSTDGEAKTAVAGRLEELERLGFMPAGDALDFDLGRQVTVFPFVHREHATYATVSRFGEDKIAFDFVTLFDQEKAGLTSSPEVGAGCLPAEDGKFLQIFPDAVDAKDLYAHHQRGVELLTSRGLAKDAVVPENLPRLLAVSLVRKRELFLRASWRNTLTALVRTLRKTSPYLGPLTSQQEARTWLAARPVRKTAGAPASAAVRGA